MAWAHLFLVYFPGIVSASPSIHGRVKAEAQRMAQDDRRSLAQWIELMIEAEAVRRAAKP